MTQNRTHFPTDSSFRIAFALRVNAVIKKAVCILPHEIEEEIRADIVSDIARANDMAINYIGFGSTTQVDIDWLVEAHDRHELWHTEGQRESFIALWEAAK